MTPRSLSDLERDVDRDLRLVSYPADTWVPGRTVGAAGVLDVLVVGAGQGGLTVASKLLRDGVTNLLVIDEAPEGGEGIWLRYARMETLRTPKHIGGPDLGIPSLTFQAWYEAQHDAAAFAALRYIPKEAWQEYLNWFRRVLRIPVRNNTRFCGVAPAEGCLRSTVVIDGREQDLLTRKLVLAGGIETSGSWWMPRAIESLPRRFRAHTADEIDFEKLRGSRVAVIGAGASAFDNAAVALEHGADVCLLCRRPELQRVQPYKALAYAGFLRHFGELDDPARWRMMNHLLTVREALTRETWDRATRHPNFEIVTGAPVTAASIDDASQSVVLDTPRGSFRANFVICGTGFEIDLRARPELRGVAEHVALWADRYEPPAAERNDRLGRYPYLDAGMAFTEKRHGAAPWIRDIHCFNFGTTLSFGPSGSSLSALKFAAPRLADAITRDLFRQDAAYHERRFLAYDTPEFPLTFARDEASRAGPGH
jgi:cation diffusion facilitator CzcD-associated flavoprotein CzcO